MNQDTFSVTRSRYLASRGFTLLELLTVIVIMGLVVGISGPAFQGLTGAGTVNRAIGDLSGALSYARTYAMVNHTYVRVALGQVAASAQYPKSSVAVLLIYSASGGLDADSASGMADAAQWPALRPPIFLNNVAFSDSLNGKLPDTNADVEPSQTDIGSLSGRTLPSLSGIVFTGFIQFGPSGAARVLKNELARNIKIGLDNPGPRQGINPFILRLSGINGTIIVLRKEDM